MTRSSLPLLTKLEEDELVKLSQEGCRKSQEKLLLHYTPLIRKYARFGMNFSRATNLVQPSFSVFDLIQDLNITFLEKIQTYSLERELRLYSYLPIHLKNTVISSVGRMGGPTRIMTNLPDKKVIFAKGKLSNKNNGNIDSAEVAIEANVERHIAERVLNFLKGPHVSLNNHVKRETSSEEVKNVFDQIQFKALENAKLFDENIIEKDMISKFFTIFNKLNEEEKFIVKSRLSEDKFKIFKELGITLNKSAYIVKMQYKKIMNSIISEMA